MGLIFLTLWNAGRSHFNLFQEKHLCLFMLCIVLMCQLYRVVIIIVVRFILLLFDFHSILLFDSFAFHCSLFIVRRKQFNSDPGLQSRYFDPLYVKYLFIIIYASQINIIHQTGCTIFVLVQLRVTYYNHRHSGIYGTNILQVVKVSRGRDTSCPLFCCQLFNILQFSSLKQNQEWLFLRRLILFLNTNLS